MGKLTQGLLGQVTGKVGGMVGSTWKGINTARGYQPNVRNPRSAAQVGNRNAMGMCAKVGSACLGTICVPLWNRSAKGHSGYNAFCSANKVSFDENGVLVPSTFDIAKGKLFAPVCLATGGGDGDVTLSITAVSDPFALASDKVFAFVWDGKLDENGNPIINFSGDTGKVRSEVEGATFEILMSQPLHLGSTANIFLAFMRADGSIVSNTGRTSYVIA